MVFPVMQNVCAACGDLARKTIEITKLTVTKTIEISNRILISLMFGALGMCIGTVAAICASLSRTPHLYATDMRITVITALLIGTVFGIGAGLAYWKKTPSTMQPLASQ